MYQIVPIHYVINQIDHRITLNSVATFEVKIVLFSNSSICQKNNVLSDLHRNYKDIVHMSDIMILSGDTSPENIPVHKAILTLQSPVFKAMFDSNMTESSSNQIQISDFDETSIRRMVEFLYKRHIH